MRYDHTQHAPLPYILHAVGLLFLILAVLSRQETAALLAFSTAGFFLIAAGLAFGNLRVRDEETFLAVRFGPLGLFGTNIPYDAMTDVAPARSSPIDGWGIHYLPGRGWIYNLWGFDCVKITLGDKVVRVGTDDMENLMAFLLTQIVARNRESAGKKQL